MFDHLKTIFNVNESESESESENENESANENENENESESECENKSDDEQYYKIKQINNIFKMIDKKSLEDQIDILKKIEWLGDYWHIEYYEDNKKKNLKIFKLKFTHICNDVNDDLFKEIFGLTFVELADKLTNTTSKEKNQMLFNDKEINRDKIFKREYGKFII